MKIPQLRKKPEIKSCHNVTWEDNYSWIHQENILEVLKDSSKLLPEVKKYLEEETVTIVIQINGKKKGIIETKKDGDEETIQVSFLRLLNHGVVVKIHAAYLRISLVPGHVDLLQIADV